MDPLTPVLTPHLSHLFFAQAGEVPGPPAGTPGTGTWEAQIAVIILILVQAAIAQYQRKQERREKLEDQRLALEQAERLATKVENVEAVTAQTKEEMVGRLQTVTEKVDQNTLKTEEAAAASREAVATANHMNQKFILIGENRNRLFDEFLTDFVKRRMPTDAPKQDPDRGGDDAAGRPVKSD